MLTDTQKISIKRIHIYNIYKVLNFVLLLFLKNNISFPNLSENGSDIFTLTYTPQLYFYILVQYFKVI